MEQIELFSTNDYGEYIYPPNYPPQDPTTQCYESNGFTYNITFNPPQEENP